MPNQLLARRRTHAAGAAMDDGTNLLAPLLARNSENRRLRYRRMRQQRVYDLGGVDVLAAGNDHVFATADDAVSPRLSFGNISRTVPAVEVRR